MSAAKGEELLAARRWTWEHASDAERAAANDFAEEQLRIRSPHNRNWRMLQLFAETALLSVVSRSRAEEAFMEGAGVDAKDAAAFAVAIRQLHPRWLAESQQKAVAEHAAAEDGKAKAANN